MRWLVLLVIALPVMLGCGGRVTWHGFGDSLTAEANGYRSKLATALGVSITNQAVSGHQAADQAIVANGVSLGSGDKATVLIGTNDHWKYGTSATKKEHYRAFLTAIAVRLGAPYRIRGIDAGMSYTGTWDITTVFGCNGKKSSQNGSTVTTSVSGTAVYIGTILQDVVTGTADVYIDGVRVGSLSSNGAGINTQAGASYAPAVFRFGGLTTGNHTVQLVVTSPSGGLNILYVEYIAGSDQLVKPSLYIGTIPRMTSAGYASLPGALSSDQNVAAYNAIVGSVTAALAGDGLDIKLVDVSSAINPSVDLGPDGIHFAESGRINAKNAYYATITGGISYTQVSTWLGSDGSYYIDTPSGKTLLAIP
jgi:hypothetical protein